jgi:hypothetical protein
MSENIAQRKPGRAGLLVLAALLILAAFWMTPYWAVAGFAQATRSQDTIAMAPYLDVGRLRDGLKHDAMALLRPKIEKGRNKFWGAVGVALGTALLDRAVDDHVSPENIAKVLGPYLSDYTTSRSTLTLRLMADNHAGWNDLDTFSVQITNDVAMTWKRDGLTWRLTAVNLPKPARAST